jgi:hypothetical protein
MRSACVREVLKKDPRANAAAVNEAWRAAGMPGEISAGLINHMRFRLGLSGNLRVRSAITTRRRLTVREHTRSNGSTSTVGRIRTDDLIALEVEIDRLLM